MTHPLLAEDLASQWLGLKVLHTGDGTATVTTTLRPEMMNGFGLTHGGIIFAIADSAFAFACNPTDSDGSTHTVASGADINFLRPTFAGQQVTAIATRRAASGRSGIFDVQVFARAARDSGDTAESSAEHDGDAHLGELVAEFRGRSRTIPARTTTSEANA
ncbi:hotdog fold thioesterase [Haematomicrobium sanguinis]|uniref:hotdog fold thioesterase n=1 Tax=Haematomicrobium sanguinis TaxID=479106 RepID=UPI0005526A41|nr:hotdog fold thioesterase [Haematomicrobium sanguinis]